MSACNKVRADTFKNLLPSFIREGIYAEEKNWKELIFKNLPIVFGRGNYEEIDFWLSSLNNYFEFEVFSVEPSEVETLAKILYNFISTTSDMNLLTTACSTFVLLVNPQHIKINIEIDWRPLYELLYDSIISHSKTKVKKYPSKLEQTLVSMIRISRSYFSMTATDEMLAMWEHMLDPRQHTFILAQCLLSLFLPVNRGQHNKWLQKFIDLWTLFRNDHFDFQFLSLFARLSRYGYNDIPWDRILPFLFNILSTYLGIPTTLLPTQMTSIANYHPELYADFFKDLDSPSANFRLFTMIVVNLLTGETREMTRSYVERILHLISPFCTASLHSEDEEQCEAPIELLNEFVSEYILRVQKEKKYTTHLEPLTQDDNDWFVSKILPLILMELYHEDPQFSSIMDVVQLAPSMTILPLLGAIESSFEYIHLKQGAYQTLMGLAPTIIYTGEGMTEFMMIIEKHLPEDLNFMDTLKSSVVFSLLTVVSSAMKFTEDHEPFLIEIAEKCILFVQHAIGDDYLTSLAELLTMLGCVIRSVTPKFAYKIAQMVKNEVDNIPESGLGVIIEALDVYSVKTFQAVALHPSKLKDYVILESIIRQNEVFTLDNIEAIKEIIKNGLNGDERKIQRRLVHTIKWLLKNLVSVYPHFPKNSGYTSITDATIKWHVPTPKEIEASKSFIEFAIVLMHEKFQKDDRKSHKIATNIARSILKGLTSAISDVDFEHEGKTEFLIQPELKSFSNSDFVKYYESIMNVLGEFIQKPDTHVSIIKRILQTVIQTIVPLDSIGLNYESVLNEFRVNSQMARLVTLLPPMESMTYLICYTKAMSLFSFRSLVKKNHVTKMLRVMTDRIYCFAKYNHTRVRTLVNIYFSNIMNQFRTQFIEYIEKSIEAIKDTSLDADTLSGYCAVASSVRSIDVSDKLIDVLYEAALAVCRLIPADVPEDSARHLRQVVVVYLDQLDPCDPRLNQDKYKEMRLKLAEEAMQRHASFASARESQNYAAALVCSVIIGKPYLMKLSIFQFLVAIMTTDDNLVRECVVQLIPTVIEKLIPRITRPQGIEFEDVTPENYDSAHFKDRPFREQAKQMPRFLSEEEFTNPEIVKNYIEKGEDQLEVEERIKIHQLLFAKLCHDQTTVDTFIKNQIDAQVHKEETFLKNRVLFWSTLCRFFGYEFIEKQIKKLFEMIGTNMTKAHHVVAAELFSGCMHSIKCRPYKDVEKISLIVKPFVTLLIQTIDPEYHSIWYFAFYASFTDIDPRRIFWLYDHILTCVPKDDGLRAARSVSLICDILLDAASQIKSLRPKIEEIAAQPLFSKESLEFEHVRECSVRALSSILAISFDVEKRGYNPESQRILNRFLSDSSEIFIVRWISGQFSAQSTGTLSSGGYVLEHLNKWVDYILGKDETEEQNARSALMGAATSNWLGSIAQFPISSDSVMEMIDKMLEALDPSKKHWQVQTVQLLITESFLGSVFFFLDDSVLEGMIEDRIIPGLLHQHPDVQDAAAQLLSFVVKSSLQLRVKLPYIVNRFSQMLTDRENLARRIAGAKGLGSIISGTMLFDEVPQYIIDSFSALTGALEVDTSVENIITQFLADFWALYDNNLMSNIAETLAPFHASLRPSYFS